MSGFKEGYEKGHNACFENNWRKADSAVASRAATKQSQPLATPTTRTSTEQRPNEQTGQPAFPPAQHDPNSALAQNSQRPLR